VSSKNTRQVRIKPYKGPVGGWGSVKGVTEILLREAIPLKGSLALWHQNKPGGFACVSCSYGRPPHLSAFEFCENGAKATAWEITDRRCPPAFFADHTVTELESWSDLQLEEVGRLTEPMRWDSVSDRYVPIVCSWKAPPVTLRPIHLMWSTTRTSSPRVTTRCCHSPRRPLPSAPT